jgi:hypothetical protein
MNKIINKLEARINKLEAREWRIFYPQPLIISNTKLKYTPIKNTNSCPITKKLVVILIFFVVSVVLVIEGICAHPTLFLAGVGMFLELVLLCSVDDE